MDVRLTLTGAKEVDNVLRGLPLQFTHKVIQTANFDAAKVLVEKAKLLAPEGATGGLVDSIGTVKPSIVRSNELGEVLTGPRRGRYKGHAAHLVERGTVKRDKGYPNRGIMPKHPFMEPAYLATKDKMFDNIRDILGRKVFAFMSRTIKKTGGAVL